MSIYNANNFFKNSKNKIEEGRMRESRLVLLLFRGSNFHDIMDFGDHVIASTTFIISKKILKTIQKFEGRESAVDS